MESCVYPPKPTVTPDKGPSQTPTVAPASKAPDNQFLTDPTDTPDIFSSSIHSAASLLTLVLSALLANSLLVFPR